MTEVNPDNLHSVWSQVRHGLDEVRAKTGATWLPEDVYLSLRAKNAVLFMHGDGFFILQRTMECDGPRLFIWVLYAPSLYATHVDEIMGELRKMARTIGAKAIRMHSPRKGWERKGWKPIETIYEVDPWAETPQHKIP